MQHYIYNQDSLWFGRWRITQLRFSLVLYNLVSWQCYKTRSVFALMLLGLGRPPRSGVRVGDVRSRVWRVERHPLHVVPEPARPSAAQWLSDIIYHHRFAVMHLCVSVGRTIIPETRPLLTHTDVCVRSSGKTRLPPRMLLQVA